MLTANRLSKVSNQKALKLLMDDVCNNDRVAFVYALCDPKTGDIMYVGKTLNPKGRYSEHLRSGSLLLNEWQNRLGREPIFKILEDCSESNYEERETFWIRFYAYMYPLLNNRKLPKEISEIRPQIWRVPFIDNTIVKDSYEKYMQAWQKNFAQLKNKAGGQG